MNWLRVSKETAEAPDDVFDVMKKPFERWVLMASGLRVLPFLWLHLVSLHEVCLMILRER